MVFDYTYDEFNRYNVELIMHRVSTAASIYDNKSSNIALSQDFTEIS